MAPVSTPYRISYRFEFSDGREATYAIDLDPKTLALVRPGQQAEPDWTELHYGQCGHCPLKTAEHPRCPVAANMSDLVQRFKGEVSHSRAKVSVTTPERSTFKEVPLQEGLYSILGIVMATSGCPIMNVFKPMARFHLPFSTIEETIVRSTSMYLLRQYFRVKKGGLADMELKELALIYADVGKVNQGIIGRIRKAIASQGAAGDADQNAIVILTGFGHMLSYEIGEKLSTIEYLFSE